MFTDEITPQSEKSCLNKEITRRGVDLFRPLKKRKHSLKKDAPAWETKMRRKTVEDWCGETVMASGRDWSLSIRLKSDDPGRLIRFFGPDRSGYPSGTFPGPGVVHHTVYRYLRDTVHLGVYLKGKLRDENAWRCTTVSGL